MSNLVKKELTDDEKAARKEATRNRKQFRKDEFVRVEDDAREISEDLGELFKIQRQVTENKVRRGAPLKSEGQELNQTYLNKLLKAIQKKIKRLPKESKAALKAKPGGAKRTSKAGGRSTFSEPSFVNDDVADFLASADLGNVMEVTYRKTQARGNGAPRSKPVVDKDADGAPLVRETRKPLNKSLRLLNDAHIFQRTSLGPLLNLYAYRNGLVQQREVTKNGKTKTENVVVPDDALKRLFRDDFERKGINPSRGFGLRDFPGLLSTHYGSADDEAEKRTLQESVEEAKEESHLVSDALAAVKAQAAFEASKNKKKRSPRKRAASKTSKTRSSRK